VDNGSDDGSIVVVKNDFSAVKLKQNQRNEGFARPNNDGMKMADGRLIFLLNSDAFLRPGALGLLVGYIDAHPKVGACGPKLYYPDGRLQRSVCAFHNLWTHFCDMFFLDSVLRKVPFFARGEMTVNPYDPSKAQAVDSLMGAAILVRTEVLRTTGFFDERLSIYYNEMDWFMRMKRDGWEIHYVPDAEVGHHRGATAALVNRGFSQFHEAYENVFTFFEKHYGRGALVVYRILLAVGFFPRAIGWAFVRMVMPSERTRHMATYSWKTLLLGLRFWGPSSRITR
jgi:GT2 family glycosyltransferase